ncbi:MAG: 3'-5' exonuclease [Chloroflexi bacterium]|nr:3'-5' exonuclease [Chloroflexota bacterium]
MLVNELSRRFRQRLGLWEPDLYQSIDHARYVVIDSELTGLDKKHDAMIALSAIRMQGSRILVGETFYRLINPERAMQRENIVVHRIRPSELTNQPTIGNILKEFSEFVGDDIVVGHFVQIDWGFLNRDMQIHLGRRLQNNLIDTCRAHDWLDLQDRTLDGSYAYGAHENTDCNLFSLAQKFDIEIKEAHHALYDAFLAASLWQRYLVALKAYGVRRLGDLLPIAGA